jgi:hypothetical protein
MAYALVLETSFCGFDSHLRYFLSRRGRWQQLFAPLYGSVMQLADILHPNCGS